MKIIRDIETLKTNLWINDVTFCKMTGLSINTYRKYKRVPESSPKNKNQKKLEDAKALLQLAKELSDNMRK